MAWYPLYDFACKMCIFCIKLSNAQWQIFVQVHAHIIFLGNDLAAGM